MSEPRLVVVLSPHQNAFFPELVEVIVDELCDAGVAVVVTTEPGEHHVEPDDVFVLVPPHEYVALEGPAFVDDPTVAGRTIGISAEQPHQQFFARNAEVGARLGAVLDFSPLAVDAYRRAGVEARHLPFGYTPRWDRYDGRGARTGPPRLLYLGNKRPRRLSRLAAAADVLAREQARLLVSDNDVPNRVTGPTFVAGEDKRDLLAATRLLVNVHQGDDPYFEWLRFAEAAHCGTPVLSERSSHTAPFVAGADFAEFDGDGLSAAIESLIGDDDRLADLADSAYERLRAHPLSAVVDVLVEAAERCLSARAPVSIPARTRRDPLGADRSLPPVTRPASVVARRRGLPGRTARISVMSSDPGPIVNVLTGPLGRHGVATIDPLVAGPRQVRRLDDGLVVLAPAGCHPRPDVFERLLDAAVAAGAVGHGPVCWSGILDGTGDDGEPTLEGIWPWEPWRLVAGQHLGRLVVVRAGVVRAAAAAFVDDELRAHPHAIIQSFVAAHGGTGGHVPTPVAHVVGTPLDPSQRLPRSVVERLGVATAG